MLLIYFASVIITTASLIVIFHKIEALHEDKRDEESILYRDTVRPVLTDSSAASTIRKLLMASFK